MEEASPNTNLALKAGSCPDQPKARLDLFSPVMYLLLSGDIPFENALLWVHCMLRVELEPVHLFQCTIVSIYIFRAFFISSVVSSAFFY